MMNFSKPVLVIVLLGGVAAPTGVIVRQLQNSTPPSRYSHC